MNKIQDDEIDLFELCYTIWNGKWLISAFTSITMLMGAGYIYYKEPLYDSKINYFVDNIPPFYEAPKVLGDFKKKFFQKKNFQDWKELVGKTSLVFEDFSTTEIIDGVVIKKSEFNQLALIDTGKNKNTFITIKTNRLSVLEDFFKYADFINDLLNREYVDRAKYEQKIIKSRFKYLSLANNDIIQFILSIDRFVVTINNGAKIFSIQHPTMPIKISPKSIPIMFMSLILGGMIGIFYVFISNFISNHKK